MILVLVANSKKRENMKKIFSLFSMTSIVFASSEVGQKFKNIVDAIVDVLMSGPVASMVSLLVIISGFCLFFKAWEKAKWLFISCISGTIVIYSGTFIAKLITDAAM